MKDERVSCSSMVPNFVVSLRTDMQSCEEDDPSEPVDANLNLEAGASILSLEEKFTPEGVCWLCNPDGAAIDHGRKPLCKQARPMVIRVQTVRTIDLVDERRQLQHDRHNLFEESLLGKAIHTTEGPTWNRRFGWVDVHVP